MVDVRKKCGATALKGVSNGAVTLNFCTDEFKKLDNFVLVMGISEGLFGA